MALCDACKLTGSLNKTTYLFKEMKDMAIHHVDFYIFYLFSVHFLFAGTICVVESWGGCGYVGLYT